MQPSESPFPCHWWGTSLEDAGLGDVRPDVGTYGQCKFNWLPPLPFEMRGDFAWLATAPAHAQSIGDEKVVDTMQALARLREASDHLGLQLPEAFTNFMEL